MKVTGIFILTICMYTCICIYVCVHLCSYIAIVFYLIMHIGTDKPSHQLLHMYVVSKVVPYWRELGIQLLEEESMCMLNNIKKNHPHDVQRCYNDMIDYWNQIHSETLCNTLTVALEQIDQNALAARIKDAYKSISLSS